MPHFIGENVLSCLLNYESYLKEGSLLTFDTLKIRIRILPLK